MTIKFRCPSCGVTLNVKDSLAGRKAPCPQCRQTVTIPGASPASVDGAKATDGAKAAAAAPAGAARAPGKAGAKPVPTAVGKVPPPAPIKPSPTSNGGPPSPPPAAPPEEIDAESLAASLLADEPKPVEEQKTFTFNCPQCDDPMTVIVDLAGKQTPCPSCRRIVRVPQLEKKEPKDWRQTNKNLPSAAKQNVMPEAPVGATSTGTVSPEVLKEAGAIPDDREKLTRVQILKRVLVVGVPVILLGLGVWWGLEFISGNKQYKLVNGVRGTVEAAEKSKKSNLRPEAVAALHRGMGEWFARSNVRESREQAQKQFEASRQKLSGLFTTDHDVVVIELALTEVLLGGSDKEAEEGHRVKWSDLGNSLKKHTLTAILPTSEGRIEARVLATRAVARRLTEKGQTRQAEGLLRGVLTEPEDWRPEAYGLAGLEWLKVDQAEAEKQARAGLELYNPAVVGKGKPPDASPSLIALCLALKKPDLLPKAWREKDGEESTNMRVRQGHAIGLTLQKNPHGLEVAKKMLGPPRVHALLDAASVIQTPEKAKPYVETALDLTDSSVSSWTRTRLVLQAVRCGLLDRAGKLAASIPDVGLRGWAQLQVLRASLAATEAKVEYARADEVDSKSVSWFLAKEAVARHNAKHDRNTLATVEKWDEPVRWFGQVGYALGLQDKE